MTVIAFTMFVEVKYSFSIPVGLATYATLSREPQRQYYDHLILQFLS